MNSGHLVPTDTLYAWFEFDRIPLAPIFLAAFRDQGLPVAASQEEASVLLTGAYAADYDLIHWRFRWSQFKLIRSHTRQTLLLLETGGGRASERRGCGAQDDGRNQATVLNNDVLSTSEHYPFLILAESTVCSIVISGVGILCPRECLE